MTWLIITLAVFGYLAVGLAVTRWAFVTELEDSPRLQLDSCASKYCTHNITMVNGERHRPTKKYQDARNGAVIIGAAWLPLVLVLVVCAPFIGIGSAFSWVINRPTKAEKLTQRQRDLAALSTKARELGLPVPEEWTQDNDPMEGIVPGREANLDR